MKIVLLGFLATAGLLLAGHWGMAIKVTNYLFFALFFYVLYEIIFFKE